MATPRKQINPEDSAAQVAADAGNRMSTPAEAQAVMGMNEQVPLAPPTQPAPVKPEIGGWSEVMIDGQPRRVRKLNDAAYKQRLTELEAQQQAVQQQDPEQVMAAALEQARPPGAAAPAAPTPGSDLTGGDSLPGAEKIDLGGGRYMYQTDAEKLKAENLKKTGAKLDMDVKVKEQKLKELKSDFDKGKKSALEGAEEKLRILNNMYTNKDARKWVTGGSRPLGLIGKVAGGDIADFESDLSSIGAMTFMEQFGKLKGGGAITEREGAAARDAALRVKPNLSEKRFEEELARAIVKTKELVDSIKKHNPTFDDTDLQPAAQPAP